MQSLFKRTRLFIEGQLLQQIFEQGTSHFTVNQNYYILIYDSSI